MEIDVVYNITTLLVLVLKEVDIASLVNETNPDLFVKMTTELTHSSQFTDFIDAAVLCFVEFQGPDVHICMIPHLTGK